MAVNRAKISSSEESKNYRDTSFPWIPKKSKSHDNFRSLHTLYAVTILHNIILAFSYQNIGKACKKIGSLVKILQNNVKILQSQPHKKIHLE